MNTLVALGTGSAFLYSVIATVAPNLFARNGIAPFDRGSAIRYGPGRMTSGERCPAPSDGTGCPSDRSLVTNR